MLGTFAALRNLVLAIHRPGLKNDRGATSVEYAFMVGLIAAVIIVTVGLLGEQVTSQFQAFIDGL